MTVYDEKRRAAILEKAHHWHLRLSEADADEADRSAFDAWLKADPQHSELYDFAVTMHHAVGSLRTGDLDRDMLEASWPERAIQLKDSVSRAFSNVGARLVALGGAALSAALVFVVFYGEQGTQPIGEDTVIASFETVNGATELVSFEDGSTAVLGAASQINVTFSNMERRVTLIEGTAFFDVASDQERPFVVEAGDMRATALGTAFDVRRVADVMRVAVAEGDVEVSYPLMRNGNPTNFRTRHVLTVGHQVTATPTSGLEQVRPIATEAIGAWRDERLLYDGVSLAELVADASRYTRVPVRIDPTSETIGAIRVRGSFRSDDIDAMLVTLAEIYPIDIDRSYQDAIYIRDRSDRQD
ncbi:MAG: FecR domain-containing protein [Pseudomonadota bacterium]